MNLRQEILATLQLLAAPASVSELWDKLKQRYHKSSIYRQLESLFTAGKIHKIETSKQTLYELTQHNHAHFECVDCGLVRCLPGQAMPVLESNWSDKLQVLDISLDLRGRCEKCS